jgi:hypothetical protein
MDPSSDTKSRELQAELNRLAERLDVPPIAVGLLTNDGLNIFIDDDGTYHFAFYERGKLNFDQTGSLDDVLYWYCEGIVSSQAFYGDRKGAFLYGYEVLYRYNPEWAKRYVRDLAAFFRSISKPQDLALLPDIGESL